MDDKPPSVSCHCGAVTVSLAVYPAKVTDCNCSLCRSYGVLWAYYAADDVSVSPDAETNTYAWNGKHVDFHRCRSCGCVTHWEPRDKTRNQRGVNARLLPPDQLSRSRVRHRDGANTGKYLD